MPRSRETSAVAIEMLGKFAGKLARKSAAPSFTFMPPTAEPLPPSLALLLLEFRAIPELASLAALYRALLKGPTGDGHPVLLLPGLLSSDWAMRPLAGYLRRIGYQPEGWGLGINRGPVAGIEQALQDRLAALADTHGRRVTLIGASLGGIYARQLSKVMPSHVRSVVTLGSPYAGSPKSTRAWRLYEWASGLKSDHCHDHLGGSLATPLSVPSTSIYSHSDGICAWRGCISRPAARTENVRVPSSHVGMPHNPFAFHVIADRLAQAEGSFAPFPNLDARGLLRRIIG